MNLAPLPIQKFFDNNGRPLDRGQLFTYVSGTTTKIATYTDSSGGASNTNPIVLDFRGECRIWIDPTKSYTFVLAPRTDSDPPTNPFWTVNDITAAPFAFDNAAVDTGSVNNIALAIPQISSPVAFTRIVFKAANTNTSAVTISINGGTAKPLTWQPNSPLTGGEVFANGIYEAVFDGVEWQLQGPTLLPGDVRLYGATGDGSTDDSAALQAAFDQAHIYPVKFAPNKTYKANSTLTFPAQNGLQVEGNGATIDSYASGGAIAFSLVGGTTYPVECVFRNINLAVNGGSSRSGWILRTSHSRFERCGVVLRSDAVSAKGYTLVGDESGGTGPYYNMFVGCSVAWTRSDQTGVLFSTAAPIFRAPNTNTWFGGRVAGTGGTAFIVTGGGNNFYGPTVEATTTTAFSFVSTAAGNCSENNVHGAYLENPTNGFVFGAGTTGNGVFGAFVTNVTTLWTDSGTGNFRVLGGFSWKAADGIEFTATSSNANALDYYGESTFTPGATFATPGDVSVTLGASNSGDYTRIGNRVFFNLDLDISNMSFTTAAGDFRVNGLPFAAASGDDTPCVVGFHSANITYSGGRTWLAGQIVGGQSYLVISQQGSAAASTNAAVGNFVTANPLRMRISGMYKV